MTSKTPTPEDIQRYGALIDELSGAAEKIAKKLNFNPREMLGVLSCVAARWAHDHRISPAEYEGLQLALLNGDEETALIFGSIVGAVMTAKDANT